MKMPFLFGIHCHQPVGNFSHVVDEAVSRCYAPFMQTALDYPQFRFAVHYSGWLLEHIRKFHENVFNNMKILSDNNQIEFFTGGYYEPVLSAIPSCDRRGQIDKLSRYIKNHFGQFPDGLWLTERVWDPAIITDVVEVGVKNMIVDDYHFISAGYYKEMLDGFYITEQDGKRVNLFPIDKNLRYLIPFKDEKDIMKYLETVADRGGKCSVIFDDGEKFGVWPSTHEWVYEKGWLKRFLELTCSSDKVEFAFFTEVAEKKPSGLAYLPVTSYQEMGEWSLFSGRTEEMAELEKGLKKHGLEKYSEAFVKGGIWKNFFAKYPESNRIHKRTLRLSANAQKIKDPAFTEALYKAQCNDALWHGIFGGLYLPNLRNNSWSFIIEAEKEFERTAGVRPKIVEIEDLDYDGYLDAYVRTETFNASFTSRDCGQMTTLELKRNNVNLINTIARRREAYHKALLSDKPKQADGISTIHDQNTEITEEMKALLVYDWYNRNSFVDHVVNRFDEKEFSFCAFNELSDFTNNPAEMIAGKNWITFSRKGVINCGGQFESEIIKKYAFKNGGIDYEITLKTDCPAELIYVCELNFHMWDMVNITVNKEKTGQIHKGDFFNIADGMTAEVAIYADKAQEAYSYVFSTVSQSEKGIELTAQGVSLFIPIIFTGMLTLKGRLKTS